MKKVVWVVVAVIYLLLPNTSAAAWGEPYPDTLYNGAYVLVSGRMGGGQYVDMSSRLVEIYNPPHYQIAINVVSVTFSEDYYRAHGTYIGGPYKVYSDQRLMKFRYDYDTKAIWVLGSAGVWKYWDIYRVHTIADGHPLIPYSAEAAFAAAYNMRFFGSTTGYGGERVISEDFYKVLGV